MPGKTKRPCRAAGCRNLTTDRSGHCDEHKSTENGWAKREKLRGNRHARGYGKEWERTRARILRRDRYLCQPCLRAGRATTANEVDHITAKEHGGTEEDANLQAICLACHKAKTARERNNHGKDRTALGSG